MIAVHMICRDAAASQGDTDRGTEITRLGSRKLRKGRRATLSLRNVLLLLAVASCLLTMFWFLFLRGPSLPA